MNSTTRAGNVMAANVFIACTKLAAVSPILFYGKTYHTSQDIKG
jgi:hypothetical protein